MSFADCDPYATVGVESKHVTECDGSIYALVPICINLGEKFRNTTEDVDSTVLA